MPSMTRVLSFLAAAVAASTTCGLVEAKTLVEIVAARPDLSMLLDLMKEIDFASILNEVTLFAPSNEAFTKRLAPETLAKLKKDPLLLVDVLSAHVVRDFWNSTELLERVRVKTLLPGSDVIVKQRKDGAVTVDQSVVKVANVMASNGIAHLIDYVIVPPLHTTVVEIASQGLRPFRALSELLILANLTGTLSGLFPGQGLNQGVTLFAPSDEAFGKLPKEVVEKLLLPENREILKKILLFHVVHAETGCNIPGAIYKTLEGSEVTVVCGEGTNTIFVGGKKAANQIGNEALTTGAMTGNGQFGYVIQLDSVLLPPDVNLGNLTAM